MKSEEEKKGTSGFNARSRMVLLMVTGHSNTMRNWVATRGTVQPLGDQGSNVQQHDNAFLHVARANKIKCCFFLIRKGKSYNNSSHTRNYRCRKPACNERRAACNF